MLEQVFFRFRLWRERPETALIIGFAATILLGTFLLALPVSSASDSSLGVMTAAFTSTSATCVTGLIVVDTGTAFSRFGQTVILLLIQTGGLGIMTFTAIFASIGRQKISIQSQLTLRNTFLARSESISLRRLLIFIFLLTFSFEAAGAVILFIQMNPAFPFFERAFHACFHAVSAFCNAGFSLSADSLEQYGGSWVTLSTFMILIIAGGLGYPVYLEIREHLREPETFRWSLHTKTVLVSTVMLIVAGTVLIKAGMPELTLLDALFQSVTTRTAGFNSIHFGNLAHSVMLVMMLLMLIGGSPGSTAGGIKTTAFAGSIIIWKDWLLGRSRKRIFRRKLSEESSRKIKAVVGLALLWIVFSLMVLLYSETRVLRSDPAAFQDLLFEIVSALGTVGLSTGATPRLTTTGQIVIMLSMFIGRVGPLAVVTSLIKSRKRAPAIGHPEEKIMIG